jgi:GNAT superfamily N-acetyltransferase
MEIIRVTDDSGAIVEPAWLARAEAVHRQLRPQLPAAYAETMRGIFDGGGEMCVAAVDETVVGVAVFRSFANTFSGRKFYVDDLVTDERHRSSGVGRALLAFLERIARGRGVEFIELDSGTQRTDAHRFYFREGFVIPSFCFRKRLPP